MNNQKLDPAKFGEHHWHIQTDITPDDELCIMADTVEISPTGDLIAVGHTGAWEPVPLQSNAGVAATREKMILMIITRGSWKAAYQVNQDCTLTKEK